MYFKLSISHTLLQSQIDNLLTSSETFAHELLYAFNKFHLSHYILPPATTLPSSKNWKKLASSTTMINWAASINQSLLKLSLKKLFSPMWILSFINFNSKAFILPTISQLSSISTHQLHQFSLLLLNSHYISALSSCPLCLQNIKNSSMHILCCCPSLSLLLEPGSY